MTKRLRAVDYPLLYPKEVWDVREHPEALLFQSYQALVRGLLLSLAGQAPKGQAIAFMRRLFDDPVWEPTSCSEIGPEEAIDDFATGTDRSARIMRLLKRTSWPAAETEAPW